MWIIIVYWRDDLEGARTKAIARNSGARVLSMYTVKDLKVSIFECDKHSLQAALFKLESDMDHEKYKVFSVTRPDGSSAELKSLFVNIK